MIVVDWGAVAFGITIGTGMSAVFFAGLGFGMRLALRTARPVNILVLSAFVRIAALLGAVWGIAQFAGPFALIGFTITFFVTRTIVMTIARAQLPTERAS